jgi:hypothetical protein
VASSALACEDCEVLYTNDPVLLQSAPLIELAEAKPMIVSEAPGEHRRPARLAGLQR